MNPVRAQALDAGLLAAGDSEINYRVVVRIVDAVLATLDLTSSHDPGKLSSLEDEDDDLEDEEEGEFDYPWYDEGDRIMTPQGIGTVVKVNAAHNFAKDIGGWYYMCEMDSGKGEYENLSTFYHWEDGSGDDLELIESA